MRVAIVGHGKMGSAVAREAGRRGHEVVATIDLAENPSGGGLTADALAGAEVTFEFTTPAAAPGNLARLAELGCRIVTGTTGWHDQLPRIEPLVASGGGALLYAANFSLGMMAMRHAVRALTRALRHRPEFDAALHEAHHNKKLDAPSGTALLLQSDLRSEDSTRAWPITSERVGWVPGTHRLTFDAEFETVTVTHTARDRAVFAVGAVVAGEWLLGRRGVFTFDDVLTGDER